MDNLNFGNILNFLLLGIMIIILIHLICDRKHLKNENFNCIHGECNSYTTYSKQNYNKQQLTENTSTIGSDNYNQNTINNNGNNNNSNTNNNNNNSNNNNNNSNNSKKCKDLNDFNDDLDNLNNDYFDRKFFKQNDGYNMFNPVTEIDYI